MDGVDPALVIGPSTEIISGNGRILTAGAIDCHVHLICPQLLDEALGAGITTIIGGGTGPAEGTKATTVTPARGTSTGCSRRSTTGRSTSPCSARATPSTSRRCGSSSAAGAAGFKLHEDWGTTPAAIDACLRVADASGVQVAIHTDTLNEAGYVESTLAAIAGRSIHTYHTEGAGGGHAPDIITVAVARQRAAVVDQPDPSAHGQHRRRAPRHVDGVPPPQPGRARGPRLRREPHPPVDDRRRGHPPRPRGDLDDRLGLAGDGPDRRGRAPHLADGARDEAAPRPAAPATALADNLRARRYVAKYTICPAITHGLQREVGSVEVGKLADLVLWDPAFFGVRPHVVIKGGMIAWAHDGRRQRVDPHAATAASPADVRRRTGRRSRTFGGVGRRGRARRRAGRSARRAARRSCRSPTPGRSARPTCRSTTRTPDIEIDPDTFAVRIDGELVDRAARHRAADGAALLPVLSPGWTAALLLLADGRFPAGGHAYSAGVEAAVAVGDVVDVADARALPARTARHHRTGRRRLRRVHLRPLRRSRRRSPASSTTSTPPA